MSELYEFSIGSEIFRYTSGRDDFTFNGNIYTAQAITRNEISKSFENESASIVIPQFLAPAPLFRAVNPITTVKAVILRSNGVKLFVGSIASCSFNIDKGEANIKLVSLQGMMKSTIPNRTYGTGCSFDLFDDGCSKNRENYKLTLTNAVLNNINTTITSTALSSAANGYYTGGYVELGNERDYIISHAAGVLTLLYPLQTYNGQNINVYPGCDKILETCKNKFNNEKNYGGFPFVPSKNPSTEGI